jgi:hypothetical protein
LGFNQPFRVGLKAGCEKLGRGKLSWRQSAGEPLKGWRVEADGKGVRATTAAIGELFEEPLPWGVVPVSARQQGRARIEVTWRGAGGEVAQDSVEVAAIARSRGLPNVPVGTHVLLGGDGWRVKAGPNQKNLREGPPTLLFAEPAGTWQLVDGAGQELTLKSAPYDQVPLDCTRSECHQDQTRFVQDNPMSSVFLRGSHGLLGPAYPTGCALACHSLGEPGAEDGGFVHIAHELGVPLSPLPRQDALPASLQRLSGVGCLSCHGPAAIPEEGARHLVLGVGVCAYCHDAPPRYGHVAAWQASRMAHSDREPRTREPGCRHCHTSDGFIAWHSQSELPSRASDSPMGIGCAACHQVHATQAQQHLLRNVKTPELLSTLPSLTPSTKLCAACHSPARAQGKMAEAPMASAAALWAGRGGFDREGKALTQPGPHTELGCVDCHRAGDSRLERGAGHSFKADKVVCARCHASEPSGAELGFSSRLRALVSRLDAKKGASSQEPPHARPARVDLETAEGRARYDLLLLLEDPARLAHNPLYARLLLEEAEAMLAPQTLSTGSQK